MKTLGMTSICFGAILIVIAFAILLGGSLNAIVPFGIGTVAIACGAICVALKTVVDKMGQIDRNVSSMKLELRALKNNTGQISAELGTDDCIGTAENEATDHEIAEMLE